MKIKSNSRWAE